MTDKTILYVDDDADDRELLWDVMQKITPAVNITFAENGLKALELLDDSSTVRPCLIVLDLNMPYLDGRQTFERLKAHQDLHNIPVVILTSGENPVDKTYFAKHHIPYFNKPVRLCDMEILANDLSTLCQ